MENLDADQRADALADSWADLRTRSLADELADGLAGERVERSS